MSQTLPPGPSFPPGQTSPSAPGKSYPVLADDKIQDFGCEEPRDRFFNKEFSRGIALHTLEEFKAGKYSTKYIETYLDFIHLEGFIDNLSYLKLKQELQEFLKS